MDASQILLTSAVGLAASVVTALVTHLLTRAQERRKNERDIAAKLADQKSTQREDTMIMAVQYGHSCFIIERGEGVERDRVFLPIGSRITAGRGPENHIVLNHPGVSRTHAAFRAQGNAVFLEPLAATVGIALNGHMVEQPRKLVTGDEISVPGTPFRITFVPLVA